MKHPWLFVLSFIMTVGCRSQSTAGQDAFAAPASATRAAAANLTDLSASVDAARTEFNEHKHEPRFLTVLSPTCPACQRGGRAVRLMLDGSTTRSLLTMVVWIPMIDGDGLSAASKASERFRGLPIPQFWDSQQKLGKEVARSIGAPEWTAWDIYLFYPPGAEWTDRGLPAPAAALAQLDGVVVGTKGTLPPLADQSRLSKRMSGKVDVVGEQSNLEALLTQVAEPFARRYAKAR
jgi:hypothetical protein